MRGPNPPNPASDQPRYRVLFVCYGNVCRSPMAEGILRGQLAQGGLFGRVIVDSAGTSSVNAGRRADGRARAIVSRRGGSIRDLRAREFVDEDFDNFDLILVMDESNRRDVLRRARGSGDTDKVRMLLDYVTGGEVSDPVEGASADFERAYDVIERASHAVLKQIRAELDREQHGKANSTFV